MAQELKPIRQSPEAVDFDEIVPQRVVGPSCGARGNISVKNKCDVLVADTLRLHVTELVDQPGRGSLRVCPETLSRIAELSQHEAD